MTMVESCSSGQRDWRREEEDEVNKINPNISANMAIRLSGSYDKTGQVLINDHDAEEEQSRRTSSKESQQDIVSDDGLAECPCKDVERNNHKNRRSSLAEEESRRTSSKESQQDIVSDDGLESFPCKDDVERNNHKNRRSNLPTQKTKRNNSSKRSVESDDCSCGQPTGKKRGSINSLASQLSDWDDQYQDKKKEMKRDHTVKNLRDSITRNPSRLRRHFAMMDKRLRWLVSLQNLDPRYQIVSYFEEVARQGGALKDPLAPPPELSFLRIFVKASAFTVWRPTSNEAIAKMMKGEATGKGLDVKGKSAKCGILSGLIPFLQIHQDEHKKKAAWPPSHGRITVYYKDANQRAVAEKELKLTLKKMMKKVTRAKSNLDTSSNVEETQHEEALIDMKHKVDDPTIRRLTESGIGLDIPERVFFETYITKQDITREAEYETGRPSRPAFQDMNFACTRKYKGHGPRAVVLQTSTSNPMCPKSLVVAYEENHRVTPVVSDFDCFTIGTRGVKYNLPLPDDQVELTKWMIGEIENILENPGEKGWTSRWLDVLKSNAVKGFKPSMPEYGFGDPVSYDIVEGAVARFAHKKNGAVRHGAECFNYLFPQELDDQFLVISDTFPGKVPWKYMDNNELKDFLSMKIDEGFCFPLNPKWILSDKGWKKLYDKMMASKDEEIQRSLDAWYPRESGIRERFENIHARFPDGFETLGDTVVKTSKLEGTEAKDLAEDELRRYLIIRRAKVKVRAALMFGRIGGMVIRSGDKTPEGRMAVVSSVISNVRSLSRIDSSPERSSTNNIHEEDPRIACNGDGSIKDDSQIACDDDTAINQASQERKVGKLRQIRETLKKFRTPFKCLLRRRRKNDIEATFE